MLVVGVGSRHFAPSRGFWRRKERDLNETSGKNRRESLQYGFKVRNWAFGNFFFFYKFLIFIRK